MPSSRPDPTETARPDVRVAPQIEGDAAKLAIGGRNCQKIAVQPHSGTTVDQPCGEMRTVSAQQQHSALGVPQQRADACTVKRDVNCLKPAHRSPRKCSRLIGITKPHVSTKAEFAGHPRKQKYHRQ